jgi:geranylgeranyl diphosphate synthase type II
MPTKKKDLFELFINYWSENVLPYASQEPKKLYAPMHYIAHGGGKRMRPMFMLMAGNLFTKNVKAALPVCFCVELFHNFTLLHDDIMDEAPLRRGRETVHEKWDTNTAILSGDLMMIESLRHLERIENSEIRSRVSNYFLKGAVAVCEGQQIDMDFEERDDVVLDEYIGMIRLKTAALLAEGMAMAAASCGATKKEDELIRGFGYAVGTAFQIQDDILDTYGDPAKFGKKVGGDIAQNKKTFLYLRALELADDDTKKQILHHYSEACELPEKEKIAKVTSLFDQVGIREVVEQEKMRYTEKGFECLAELGVEEGRLITLKDFALQLVEREV